MNVFGIYKNGISVAIPDRNLGDFFFTLKEAQDCATNLFRLVGHFWRANNKFYVNCYSESFNPEREKIIKKTNEAIQKLVDEMEPKTSSWWRNNSNKPHNF